jgi:hypothetical protein
VIVDAEDLHRVSDDFRRSSIGASSSATSTGRSAARCLCLVLVGILIAVPNVVQADTVRLKNGDRVSGTILRMETEQLEIDTGYAGRISISWGDIQSVHSDHPLTLRFFSDSAIPEGIGLRDGDRVIVTDLEAEGPIRFSDVKAINGSDLYHRGNINLGGNVVSGNANTQALNAAAS